MKQVLAEYTKRVCGVVKIGPCWYKEVLSSCVCKLFKEGYIFSPSHLYNQRLLLIHIITKSPSYYMHSLPHETGNNQSAGTRDFFFAFVRRL